MRYIVDGYNAVRRDPALARAESEGGLESGRDALIERIVASGVLAKARVLVVFDGQPSSSASLGHGRRHPSLNVRFSTAPESADDAILDLLRSRSTREEITVVTADAELAFGARRAGASVMGPEAWEGLRSPARRRVSRPSPGSTSGKPAPTSKDTSYWLDIFGDGE